MKLRVTSATAVSPWFKRCLRSSGWFFLYLGLAFALLLPFSLHLDTELPDDGDAVLGMWILWWGATHLSDGYPGILEANAYYPHPGGLMYTEPLLGPALVAWPLFHFLDNRVLATNLLMLLTLALSAWGAHLLFRELSGSDTAAAIGAVYYALGCYNLSQLARLQLVTLQWLPLALLCLHRFFVYDKKRWLAGFVVFSILHGVSCFYYLSFYVIILVILVPAYFFAHRTYENKQSVAWLAVAGASIGATFLFVAWPFLQLYGFYEFKATSVSFDLARYWRPPLGNLMYSTVPDGSIDDYFLGFAALSLAAVGFVSWLFGRSAYSSKAVALAFFLIGVLGLLFSGGPDLLVDGARWGPGPFRVLQNFPPFENLRDPGRMAVLPRFAVALFVAQAAAYLLARRTQLVRATGGVLLGGLLLLEQWSPRYGHGSGIPTENVPDVYAFLAAREHRGPVAELPVLPFRLVRFNTLDAYFSSFHQGSVLFNKPSFYPPATEYLRWELRNFPDDTSTTLLSALGIRTAVVHPKRWGSARRQRRRLRHLEARSAELPLVRTFPDRVGDPLWEHFDLGREQLHAIRPLAEEGAPRQCRCREVERDEYELRSGGRGDPHLAADGDRSTRWTTGEGQQRGHFLTIVFDRPRRPARIEIEMAFPYDEFARNLEIMGRLGSEMFPVPVIEDVWYKTKLVRQLVRNPVEARLRYELEPMLVDRLRLYIARTESGSMPWSVPEVHVFEADEAY